jgi:hypothetical protein
MGRATYLATLLFALSARAADLPIKLQAVLMKKILLYDRTLQNPEGAKILVVYADEAAEAEEMVHLLKGQAINASLVKVSALAQEAAGAQIIYVFSHAVSAVAKELGKKVLTFGGSESMAERGELAVAMVSHDNRPEIVISLATVRAAGHQFASEMLGLAKVVNP